MFKQFISLLLVVGLTACGSLNLNKLRHTELEKDDFHTTLAREYLAFSESEANQYDWRSVNIFSTKGLSVSYGKDIEPEELKNWDLPEAKLNELTIARETLLTLLTNENKAVKPQASARALFLFDCWVEQQEENWQNQDIDLCKQMFFNTVEKLAPAPELKKIITKDTEIFASSYLLFFNFDSSDLAIDSIDALREIARALQEEKGVEIVLNGHADRSGEEEYNLDLSLDRAEQVRQQLLDFGVPETNISYFAFGESDPLVPTEDGAREPKNRRVEIFINQ
jgi:OOP family OmpA-OmpF porin